MPTITATTLIADIAAELAEDDAVELYRIRAALEDGGALASLGVTDHDKPAVEVAHDIVGQWISAGLETYGQAVARAGQP